jgi:tRNA(Ile)-lysidine synthase
VFREDEALIQTLVEETWQNCVSQCAEGFVAIDATILASQPVGLKRRIIRKGIAQLRPGLRDVGFDTIERSLEFLAAIKKPGQIDLVSNLRLVYEPGRLWLVDSAVNLPTEDWPQLSVDSEIRVDEAGEINLEGNWQIQVEVIANIEAALEIAKTNQDRFQAWLAVDIENDVIILRTMRQGDRIQPMGMLKGTQKISDFMIDHKLPRRARRGWPLVWIGDKLAWVPGYHLGQGYQLDATTRKAIHFSLTRNQ